jgi:PleD family two-component response regulator
MDNNKYRILIVDDSPLIVMELTKILQTDYEVHSENDGKNIVEATIDYKPDVILLDIIMPELDGYTALASLKNNDDTKDIPVIFISGLSKSAGEEKGLAWGAADYITKPFTSEIVKLRVQNQIMILEQLKEIEAANEINRAKTEFLGNMINEIRIAIDNIDSLSEMAYNENIDDKAKKYFTMISKCTRTLLNITESIIDYNKGHN